MEFSRQEYWSRLPIPGDLPDPGIEPISPGSPLSPASPISPALAGRFFATEPPGKTRSVSVKVKPAQAGAIGERASIGAEFIGAVFTHSVLGTKINFLH